MQMGKLEHLKRKKKKLVVGLMSGTSVDAVDAVLAEISGCGMQTRLRQRAFISYPYPKGFRRHVLGNSQPGSGTVDTISQLNVLIAHFFADAASAVARKARVPLNEIDLIGSHGQTVHHIPVERKLFGKQIRSTLQLGDPSVIAALTGVPTVGNFRTADMALGGQGAPLVPYFDFLMFRSAAKNRALLNIGGIANMTLLKKNCTVNTVVAFDTGPGNMVIDALMKDLYGKELDEGGTAARRGKILPPVLRRLMTGRYFSQSPPKSTGRELFGTIFVRNFTRHCRGAKRDDMIATATEFTALSVFDQFNRFITPLLRGARLDELIVSGGGAMNATLMESLRRYFYPTTIMLTTDMGIDSESKEALCFAVLANETIHELPANVPSVTGAQRQTVLGEICL